MKKKTVFVIEQGEYSDYRVVGVFSTKKKAQTVYDALKAAGNSDLHDKISEWTLDPFVLELQKGYSPFVVIMLKDGTVERCDRREFSSYCSNSFLWKRTEAPAYKGKGIPDALNATVFARNEKHAIKIANEHRTKMIANGEWK